MDIPVKIDKKSNNGDSARMVCSNCSFPLERLSGAQAKVLCPRCNTWLDVDPTCGGSCLACHKTLKNESSSACTDVASEQNAAPGKLRYSTENLSKCCGDSKSSKPTLFNSGLSGLARKVRQYLFDRSKS